MTCITLTPPLRAQNDIFYFQEAILLSIQGMQFVKSMSLVFLSEHQSNRILNPVWKTKKHQIISSKSVFSKFQQLSKQSLLCFILTGINVFVVNSLEKGFFILVT